MNIVSLVFGALIAQGSADVGFSDTQSYMPVLKTQVTDEMRFVSFSLKDDRNQVFGITLNPGEVFRTKELARIIRNSDFEFFRKEELAAMLNRSLMSSQNSQDFLLDLSAVFAAYPFQKDPFVREKMVTVYDLPEFRAEGYWSNVWDKEMSSCPFPEPHDGEWARKNVFLAKLNEVETALKNAECMKYYRGLAPSRLEEDVYVGSCEYIDQSAKIVWPCGYSQHYVAKHNVVPSADFYDYIMDLDVSQIASCKSDEL